LNDEWEKIKERLDSIALDFINGVYTESI
jgi:tetrahydromethanopterin S-methyltransferase subunit G